MSKKDRGQFSINWNVQYHGQDRVAGVEHGVQVAQEESIQGILGQVRGALDSDYDSGLPFSPSESLGQQRKDMISFAA